MDAIFDLWKTRSSRGTTTAAAMIIRSIKRTIMNPQQGKPQHRRFFFALSESCPTPADGSYGEGQGETGRTGVSPRTGVATPGGGKAASMPERPDLCFSSPDDTNKVSQVNTNGFGTYSPLMDLSPYHQLANRSKPSDYLVSCLDPSLQLILSLAESNLVNSSNFLSPLHHELHPYLSEVVFESQIIY